MASVGVAPNKFLAKIASDLKKPDALVVVEPDKVQEFLDPLPVERLWGVGKQSSKVFQRLGIRTIGQLRQWPLDVLQARFGSSGEHLWNLAHGRSTTGRWCPSGRRSRSPTRRRSSTTSPTWRCCGPGWWTWPSRSAGDCGGTGCGAGRCSSRSASPTSPLITRSQTLPEPTDITHELWRAADELLCQRLPAGHLPVRLLGMGVSGLDDTGLVQGMLFDQEERQKQSRAGRRGGPDQGAVRGGVAPSWQ